jgi:GNAT superfamily N-acetyltransferase
MQAKEIKLFFESSDFSHLPSFFDLTFKDVTPSKEGMADFIYVLENSYGDPEFKTTPQSFHFVGYVKEKPVGCISLIIEGEGAWLYNLGIIKKYRGKQVMEELCKKASEFAASRGVIFGGAAGRRSMMRRLWRFNPLEVIEDE